MKCKGTDLTPRERTEALRRFIHRYTGEHRPAWALKPWKNENGQTVMYPVQFRDDADWLAHTYFTVTKAGRLSEREEYCESHPTWPYNPELRRKD